MEFLPQFNAARDLPTADPLAATSTSPQVISSGSTSSASQVEAHAPQQPLHCATAGVVVPEDNACRTVPPAGPVLQRTSHREPSVHPRQQRRPLSRVGGTESLPSAFVAHAASLGGGGKTSRTSVRKSTSTSSRGSLLTNVETGVAGGLFSEALLNAAGSASSSTSSLSGGVVANAASVRSLRQTSASTSAVAAPANVALPSAEEVGCGVSGAPVFGASSQHHPHDQHARHGTHGFLPKGVREKCPADEIHKRLKNASLDMARDDGDSPVFSVRYRDSAISLSSDRLEATGSKSLDVAAPEDTLKGKDVRRLFSLQGWASVFATHACDSGKFYFEVEIQNPSCRPLVFAGHPPDLQPKTKPSFRVGFACRYQRYDLPIGTGSFSFALSDVGGGCFVSSATRRELKDIRLKPQTWPEDPRRDRRLYEFLQAGILCDPEDPPVPQETPRESSWIEFSINGKRLGKAFEGLPAGAYHPAVSLFMGACIRFNPGPDFKFPPLPEEMFLGAYTMLRPLIP